MLYVAVIADYSANLAFCRRTEESDKLLNYDSRCNDIGLNLNNPLDLLLKYVSSKA